MLQIQDALVSLDLAERFFCCDLDKCLGECCIEGDAGAPITRDEYDKLKEILPLVYDELTPAAQREIDENGVGYIDEEGDLVTSASCYLYPVRLTKYPSFTAVNYHRWKICKAAELLGKKEGIRLYKFLKDPLISYFGKEWYDELSTACEAYLEQYGDDAQ